jgi:hypothetical protein
LENQMTVTFQDREFPTTMANLPVSAITASTRLTADEAAQLQGLCRAALAAEQQAKDAAERAEFQAIIDNPASTDDQRVAAQVIIAGLGRA